MDLSQRKLNKSEWESIEIPVSSDEKYILQLIINGPKNVNNKINKFLSLILFLKIEYNEKMEDYLFNKYFRTTIENLKKNTILIILIYWLIQISKLKVQIKSVLKKII